ADAAAALPAPPAPPARAHRRHRRPISGHSTHRVRAVRTWSFSSILLQYRVLCITEHVAVQAGWRSRAKAPNLRTKPKHRIAEMPAEQLANAPEFTVSELSNALKRTVEDAYGHVRVRGEISGFRGPHSSGHCYFALKDESAKIEAVIWKFNHARMRFKPQEGLEVIATGKLTTYPGSSKYQIVIEALEPAGIGALWR